MSDPIWTQNLNKEDLSGDLLYAGILGYFASVDGSDNLAARTGNQVVNYRMPSYGAFMAKANPHYWFGIVRSVSFPGVVMDVDRVFYQVAAKDDDKLKQVVYMRQVGSAGSAFEHAVPERMFADPAKALTDPSQPQGVSAVKALAVAASQGQKIYTLNAQNQTYHAQIVAQLQIDADAKQEISDALNAGKEVTVHQAEIAVNGWTGCGYIMLDPGTGAGAYKISGGANGGILLLTGLALMLIIALNAYDFVLVATLGGPVAQAIAFTMVVLATSLIAAGVSAIMGDVQACETSLGIATGALGFLIGVLGGPMAGAILSPITALLGTYLLNPSLCSGKG